MVESCLRMCVVVLVGSSDLMLGKNRHPDVIMRVGQSHDAP